MSTDSIIFPGLNIELLHVGRGIAPFGFQIAYYGMVIALGMLLASLFISYNSKRYNKNPDDYYNITIFAIVCGVIGARVYYVIFSWELYEDNLISIINLRQGGLAIYGGIIGGALLVYFYSKKIKTPFLTSADIVIPGVLIGQILGRWGNFFNREAFGGYCDGPFRMGLPVGGIRSGGDITQEMIGHLETIDGVDFVFVHPTFLYESFMNFIIFIVLWILGGKKHSPGMIFALYLIFYGGGRFFIERLRTDQLIIPGTNIPVSMAVSTVCVIGGIVILLKSRKKKMVSQE